eukprot:5396946-Prymnesium_polylepis.2
MKKHRPALAAPTATTSSPSEYSNLGSGLTSRIRSAGESDLSTPRYRSHLRWICDMTWRGSSLSDLAFAAATLRSGTDEPIRISARRRASTTTWPTAIPVE